MTVETALFRNCHKEDFPGGVIVNRKAVTGVLYPSFAPKHYLTKSGKPRTRPADVRPYPYEGSQVVDPGRGASLFDKENLFGTIDWWSFTIPAGTDIPASLKIVHTGHHDVFNAEHFQIEPAALRMPVEAYKGALDNLARNAVEKHYRDAHGGA